MRFPRLALRRVREAVGPDVPIVVKLNLQDGFEDGSTLDDCIEASKIIEQDGDASLLVLTGGFSAKSPMYLFRGPSAIKPLIAIQKNLIAKLVYTLAAKKFPDMPFKEMFFLDDAKKVREAVKMPIALVGGIKSLANFKTVMHEDFDGIVLGRTLIHEPDLPKIYETGEQSTSGCISCNRCVAHIDSDDGVICPINVEMASEAA
jgi:2,4-dienoyl-CoA reductase-like NADH-dependent reductase (Old Yellow Enzyme family)